jgi:predicted dehydrogenase
MEDTDDDKIGWGSHGTGDSATAHSCHEDNTLLALTAGKAVLCEKPLTLNAEDAQTVVRTAREKKLFLMEGMWSRLIPAMTKARQMIDDGTIGEGQIVASDFGFAAPFDPKSRLSGLPGLSDPRADAANPQHGTIRHHRSDDHRI